MTLKQPSKMERVIDAIEESMDAWASGASCSPDERDHVIAACRVLRIDWREHEPLVQEIANELYDDYGETHDCPEAVARFLLARLADVKPSATRGVNLRTHRDIDPGLRNVRVAP